MAWITIVPPSPRHPHERLPKLAKSFFWLDRPATVRRAHSARATSRRRTRMGLEPWATNTLTIVVDESMTADRFGNIGVQALATPMLVSYFELAAHQLAMPALEPGQGTVGSHIDIRHLAATPIGMRVSFRATQRDQLLHASPPPSLPGPSPSSCWLGAISGLSQRLSGSASTRSALMNRLEGQRAALRAVRSRNSRRPGAGTSASLTVPPRPRRTSAGAVAGS
jgi:hypothetical protein